jgi:hypothetical protein
MKKPKKLCPFRPATRAGQKARAIQMATKTSQAIVGASTPERAHAEAIT